MLKEGKSEVEGEWSGKREVVSREERERRRRRTGVLKESSCEERVARNEVLVRFDLRKSISSSVAPRYFLLLADS